MGVGGYPRYVLEQLKERYPIALHGVGLSIASPHPVCRTYLDQLKELMGATKPTLVTDHLCWTSYQGLHTHDLLPFPLTEASLEHVIEQVRFVQSYLDRQILLENPTCYLDFHLTTIEEPVFLNTLCEETGCGLLLDLNNCFVNEQNLGWTAEDYLTKIHPNHVQQFHLAGHLVQENMRIDTHDHPICPEVWQLYSKASQRFPAASTLLEWDDHIPPLEAMVDLVNQARSLWRAGPPPGPSVPETVKRINKKGEAPFKDIQVALVKQIHNPDLEPDSSHFKATPAPKEEGLRTYRMAYYLRIKDALAENFPTLRYISGDGFEILIQEFLKKHPPTHFSLDQAGSSLPFFIRDTAIPVDFGVEQSLIADLAQMDWLNYQTYTDPEYYRPLGMETLANMTPENWETASFELCENFNILSSDYQILPVVEAIRNDQPPSIPEKIPQFILFWRQDFQTKFLEISLDEANFLRALKDHQKFQTAFDDWEKNRDRHKGEPIQEAMGYLTDCFQRNLILACHHL